MKNNMSYEVGDKVRIVSKKHGLGWNSEGRMDKWLGKTMTIREACGGYYRMAEDAHEFSGYDWCWLPHMIEGLAPEQPEQPEQKIVITTDGKTTLARLYDGKKVIKRAEAKCSSEDKFDFNVGAELAFNRLMGKSCKKETPKPKVYNGKVVCIKTKYPWWTVGKVYEVKGGIIVDNVGCKYPSLFGYRYRDADDIRHAGCVGSSNYNSNNEFIPLAEED